MSLNKNDIQKILIKINPKIKPLINKKNINFTDNQILDSLMIIKLIHEVEIKTKKKIKISTIKKNSFSNFNNIIKFFKK